MFAFPIGKILKVFDLFLPHAAKVPMVNRVTNIKALFIDFILV